MAPAPTSTRRRSATGSFVDSSGYRTQTEGPARGPALRYIRRRLLEPDVGDDRRSVRRCERDLERARRLRGLPVVDELAGGGVVAQARATGGEGLDRVVDAGRSGHGLVAEADAGRAGDLGRAGPELELEGNGRARLGAVPGDRTARLRHVDRLEEALRLVADLDVDRRLGRVGAGVG